MKLSISVQAHEKRSEWFSYLKERLGDVPFAIDRGAKGSPENIGVWENCKRAWLSHDPTSDYHLVVQDDAIVCQNFYERAIGFLEKYHSQNETRIFNFYFGNKASLREKGKNALKVGFIVKNTPSWGVGICLPTRLIPDMIKTCDTYKNPQDDVRIGKWIVKNNYPIYFPVPCFLDHRTGVKSLVGDPGINRHAMYFIDNPERNYD